MTLPNPDDPPPPGITASAWGVTITVRVRPRSRPGVQLTPEGIVVRVAAPPVDDRANREAGRVLAEALGVRSGDVVLRSGRRSRAKAFAVRGLTVDQVAARLHRP